MVFGPQTRVDLPTLRKLVPERYPIRLYPDITHTLECQFPVPDWDVAFSLTEGREPICPRPEAYANIARRYLPYSAGFGTYSEGCNDDVNKFVWTALAWDPEAKVIDVLRDYSRFFVSHRYAEDFAQGLLGLEKAWQGPLLANENVDAHLDALPDHGACRDPRRVAELALPARALPRLLRRLRAPPPDL